MLWPSNINPYNGMLNTTVDGNCAIDHKWLILAKHEEGISIWITSSGQFHACPTANGADKKAVKIPCRMSNPPYTPCTTQPHLHSQGLTGRRGYPASPFTQPHPNQRNRFIDFVCRQERGRSTLGWRLLAGKDPGDVSGEGWPACSHPDPHRPPRNPQPLSAHITLTVIAVLPREFTPTMVDDRGLVYIAGHDWVRRLHLWRLLFPAQSQSRR